MNPDTTHTVTTAPARDYFTVEQFAKAIGHSKAMVLDLIRTGEVAARDERSPSATRPRFRIPIDQADAWRTSRRVTPTPKPAPFRPPEYPRLVGVLARQIAKNRANAAKRKAVGL